MLEDVHCLVHKQKGTFRSNADHNLAKAECAELNDYVRDLKEQMGIKDQNLGKRKRKGRCEFRGVFDTTTTHYGKKLQADHSEYSMFASRLPDIKKNKDCKRNKPSDVNVLSKMVLGNMSLLQCKQRMPLLSKPPQPNFYVETYLLQVDRVSKLPRGHLTEDAMGRLVRPKPKVLLYAFDTNSIDRLREPISALVEGLGNEAKMDDKQGYTDTARGHQLRVVFNADMVHRSMFKE